jgi:hypothetical protein
LLPMRIFGEWKPVSRRRSFLPSTVEASSHLDEALSSLV